MAPLDAFAPDLILISAGFDAHARDPLADQTLEAEDYAWATRAVAAVASAPRAAGVLSPRSRAATTLRRSASRPWRTSGRLRRDDGRTGVRRQGGDALAPRRAWPQARSRRGPSSWRAMASRRCRARCASAPPTTRDWWATYEETGLLAGQTAPAVAAGRTPNRPAVIVSSTRRRSIETAFAIAGGREVEADPDLIEAPLPPPHWPRWIRLRPGSGA